MAAKKYYLALDQGTTGSTAILFDEKWHLAARGYKEITQIYPQPGWVEHDPIEIWESMLAAIQQALTTAGATVSQIACLGIDNEGESIVLWDKLTGQPVYNAIVWQDRRTARYADQLAEKSGAMIRKKTGLTPDAYFSATKIKWILDNVPQAKALLKQGRLLEGNMDAWMVWKMTHGRVHVTDASTASRTMLLNIHTGQWDEEILALFDIDPSILPTICDSAMVYGHTDPLDFGGADIPISGLLVDQQAALFGQACLNPGTIKTTYGTGCFMLMNTGKKPVDSPNGILTTVGWQLKGKMTFALDGGIYITGAATQWLRDGIKIINNASETEAMAISIKDTGGVYFVPAFTGLAAPHWDSYARGTMVGITGGTRREHIVRATLESTAYQVKDILDVMEKDSKVPISVMRCDGGATVNNFLMQFQADILGIPIDLPKITETTALGAAYLAGLAVSYWKSKKDVMSNRAVDRTFGPMIEEAERKERLEGWAEAVKRTHSWAR